MATLNTTLPTLLDQVRRMDPDGKIAAIVEALEKQNPLLQDAVFMEGNLPDGHKFTSRQSLPSIAFRRFNEGVAPSKSTTAQVREPCAMMEAYCVVDAEEANLNGNAAAFRASEDVAFMQALNQQAETSLIYDSPATDPTRLTGLLPRFASTTGPGGKQIVLHDSAASGNDQASMILAGWGPTGMFGIFPKGDKGGITHKDMGSQLWEPDPTNAPGAKFEALVSKWSWKLGLCVKDQRNVAVIRNIDTGNLLSTGNALIQSAVKAFHKIYAPGSVRLAWYVPRHLAQYLHLQALDSVKQSTLTIENVGGFPITKLLGIPVRTCDSMTITEAAIS